MFLIHINEIVKNVSSQLKLFADECFCSIESLQQRKTSLHFKRTYTPLFIEHISAWQVNFNRGNVLYEMLKVTPYCAY